MSGVRESFSSNRVRVFRLDTERVLSGLRARATRLAGERPEVLEVRLFGSLMRGDALPGSDADVLIVVSASDQPFRDRLPTYAPFFEGAGVSCDLFVYTARELADGDARAFANRARAEGLLLASR